MSNEVNGHCSEKIVHAQGAKQLLLLFVVVVVVVLSFFLARFRFDEDDWIDDKMRQNTSITNWMKMIPDFQTLILLFYFEFIILANDGKLNVFYDVIQLKDNFSKFITFRFAIHAWRNLSILISKILANEYFT